MSRKIKDYRIVRAKDDDVLMSIVMNFIENGYEPIGGIAIEPDPEGIGNTWFYQTLVKYSE